VGLGSAALRTTHDGSGSRFRMIPVPVSAAD
jgi:hypothetical protein